MELQQNMSAFLKAVQSARSLTLSEFSEELEISRSHLHKILTQKANPRIDTVEHIANKLGIEPAAMLSFSANDAQLQVIDLLLNLSKSMNMLNPENRPVAVSYFQKFMQQWGLSDDVENL